MLRRILIASAAAAMLLVTFQPTTPSPAAGGMRAGVFTAAEPCEREATARRGRSSGIPRCAVAVRGGRYGYGAHTVQGPIAATAIAVTVSVPRQWRGCGRAAAAGSYYRGAALRRYGNYVCRTGTFVLSGATPLLWCSKR